LFHPSLDASHLVALPITQFVPQADSLSVHTFDPHKLGSPPDSAVIEFDAVVPFLIERVREINLPLQFTLYSTKQLFSRLSQMISLHARYYLVDLLLNSFPIFLTVFSFSRVLPLNTRVQ